MHKIVISCVVFILASCATKKAHMQPLIQMDQMLGFTKIEDEGVLHKSSGILFPDKFGDFRRSNEVSYGGVNSNSSVDYKVPGINLTFFVYPRNMGQEAAEDEFGLSFTAAMANLNDVAEHQATCTGITLDGQSLDTFIGAFSWRESNESIGGWVFVAPGKNNYYKVRVTYQFNEDNIRDSRHVAAKMLLALVPEQTKCKNSI